MKKYSCLMMALAMLGLCACGDPAPAATGGTAAQPADVLKMGYARVNITPKESVPLAGYGNAPYRLSNSVISYLWATCLAVSDGETTAVIISMDLGNQGYEPLPSFRLELAKKLDLPEESLMFCCTHNHSAPQLNVSGIPALTAYNQQLKKNLETVARDALADMVPVTGASYGSAQTQGLTFVREYVLEDGTFAGDNYGDFGVSPIAGHDGQADGLLQLVKFTRQGGKDIVLTNFQTHPHMTGGSQKLDLSADLVGEYRDALEKDLDCCAVYFNGAAGNLNPTSRISAENTAADFRAHGQALARYAKQAAQEWKPLELGQLRLVTRLYTGDADHSMDDLVPYAEEIAQRFKDGMNANAAAQGYGHTGIQNAHQANAIISKAKEPKTLSCQLYALSLGDFSMVFAPFELYSELGMQIREGSPFAATFVACYANTYMSYLPTQQGFDHKGYGAYSSKFVAGTGEKIVAEYLGMLGEIKE